MEICGIPVNGVSIFLIVIIGVIVVAICDKAIKAIKPKEGARARKNN